MGNQINPADLISYLNENISFESKKRVSETRGEGRGVGGPTQRDGGTTVCVCPQCGSEWNHQKGTPCSQQLCPTCNVKLQGKAFHEISAPINKKSVESKTEESAEKKKEEAITLSFNKKAKGTGFTLEKLKKGSGYEIKYDINSDNFNKKTKESAEKEEKSDTQSIGISSSESVWQCNECGEVLEYSYLIDPKIMICTECNSKSLTLVYPLREQRGESGLPDKEYFFLLGMIDDKIDEITRTMYDDYKFDNAISPDAVVEWIMDNKLEDIEILRKEDRLADAAEFVIDAMVGVGAALPKGSIEPKEEEEAPAEGDQDDESEPEEPVDEEPAQNDEEKPEESVKEADTDNMKVIARGIPDKDAAEDIAKNHVGAVVSTDDKDPKMLMVLIKEVNEKEIKESSESTYTYNVEVEVFGGPNGVEQVNPSVSIDYMIEQEYRSWGIKEIEVSIITNPITFWMKDGERDIKVQVPSENIDIDWMPGTAYVPDNIEVHLNADGKYENCTLNMYYLKK